LKILQQNTKSFQKKQKKKLNKMKNHILQYDDFLNEMYTPDLVSADTFNTPGMGNVTSGAIGSFSTIAHDSGDGDSKTKQLKMHERGQQDDSWMRPSGDYSNRNWLVPNFEIFQNQRQSNARFQIGQFVRCVNPMKESYGMIGKIIAFEDNTIRWEVAGSTTGVGQTSKQYRCHAQDLEMSDTAQPGC